MGWLDRFRKRKPERGQGGPYKPAVRDACDTEQPPTWAKPEVGGT